MHWQQWLNNQWYRQRGVVSYALSPLALIYRGISSTRQRVYASGIKKISHFNVPVIVVGNITVGGTGKTPFVIWLANWLRGEGKKPGIVSRGYGGKAKTWPQVVTRQSDPAIVGDEAVLIALKTHCPMVVAPNRVQAVKKLLTEHHCDVVISDDGLQHYALGRDVEIAVIDGTRRFGNGFCLPAGPLREHQQRLHAIDFVIVNGHASENEYTMKIFSQAIYNLKNPNQIFNSKDFTRKTIHAVAGIAHPERFFQQLTAMGLSFIPHVFPDHYFYQHPDLDFGHDTIVIMTEKDAVKCRAFKDERHWCLPIQALPDKSFIASLKERCVNCW